MPPKSKRGGLTKLNPFAQPFIPDFTRGAPATLGHSHASSHLSPSLRQTPYGTYSHGYDSGISNESGVPRIQRLDGGPFTHQPQQTTPFNQFHPSNSQHAGTVPNQESSHADHSFSAPSRPFPRPANSNFEYFAPSSSSKAEAGVFLQSQYPTASFHAATGPEAIHPHGQSPSPAAPHAHPTGPNPTGYTYPYEHSFEDRVPLFVPPGTSRGALDATTPNPMAFQQQQQYYQQYAEGQRQRMPLFVPGSETPATGEDEHEGTRGNQIYYYPPAPYNNSSPQQSPHTSPQLNPQGAPHVPPGPLSDLDGKGHSSGPSVTAGSILSYSSAAGPGALWAGTSGFDGTWDAQLPHHPQHIAGRPNIDAVPVHHAHAANASHHGVGVPHHTHPHLQPQHQHSVVPLHTGHAHVHGHPGHHVQVAHPHHAQHAHPHLASHAFGIMFLGPPGACKVLQVAGIAQRFNFVTHTLPERLQQYGGQFINELDSKFHAVRSARAPGWIVENVKSLEEAKVVEERCSKYGFSVNCVIILEAEDLVELLRRSLITSNPLGTNAQVTLETMTRIREFLVAEPHLVHHYSNVELHHVDTSKPVSEVKHRVMSILQALVGVVAEPIPIPGPEIEGPRGPEPSDLVPRAFASVLSLPRKKQDFLFAWRQLHAFLDMKAPITRYPGPTASILDAEKLESLYRGTVPYSVSNRVEGLRCLLLYSAATPQKQASCFLIDESLTIYQITVAPAKAAGRRSSEWGDMLLDGELFMTSSHTGGYMVLDALYIGGRSVRELSLAERLAEPRKLFTAESDTRHVLGRLESGTVVPIVRSEWTMKDLRRLVRELDSPDPKQVYVSRGLLFMPRSLAYRGAEVSTEFFEWRSKPTAFFRLVESATDSTYELHASTGEGAGLHEVPSFHIDMATPSPAVQKLQAMVGNIVECSPERDEHEQLQVWQIMGIAWMRTIPDHMDVIKAIVDRYTAQEDLVSRFLQLRQRRRRGPEKQLFTLDGFIMEYDENGKQIFKPAPPPPAGQATRGRKRGGGSAEAQVQAIQPHQDASPAWQTHDSPGDNSAFVAAHWQNSWEAAPGWDHPQQQQQDQQGQSEWHGPNGFAMPPVVDATAHRPKSYAEALLGRLSSPASNKFPAVKCRFCDSNQHFSKDCPDMPQTEPSPVPEAPAPAAAAAANARKVSNTPGRPPQETEPVPPRRRGRGGAGREPPTADRLPQQTSQTASITAANGSTGDSPASPLGAGPPQGPATTSGKPRNRRGRGRDTSEGAANAATQIASPTSPTSPTSPATGIEG
eukprot:TRINITY_DN9308_c0_g1_i1.p1 TRINITY_DN9308_c0_g1~~TRINITY_DN9308_c0_g1_i1.p1  ORF type:complete len:1284 (-),score=138.63 TRINITY_DN9308_c0_g1_i1:295-4146(-)